MKKILQKKLLIIGLIPLMIISLTPIASSIEQKSDDIKIIVLDNTNGSLEKNERTASPEAAKNLIHELMKNKMTPTNYKQEIKKKLILLREYNLISTDTANMILNSYTEIPKIFFRSNPLIKQGMLFDMANVFSGTFFGLQGVKDFTYLDLTLYDFPFFKGNINAGFYGWSRFTGNGTIFTAGFLGFKYLYDYNETKYDFPYFPEIKGSVFGYSGLFVYIDSFNYSGNQEGPFIIGIGMSIMTLWKNNQPATMSRDT